jgi:DNA repair protein RadA/Sms
MESRLKEAAKLGFRRALAPADLDGGAMAVIGAGRLADAVRRIGDAGWDQP